MQKIRLSLVFTSFITIFLASAVESHTQLKDALGKYTQGLLWDDAAKVENAIEEMKEYRVRGGVEQSAFLNDFSQSFAETLYHEEFRLLPEIRILSAKDFTKSSLTQGFWLLLSPQEWRDLFLSKFKSECLSPEKSNLKAPTHCTSFMNVFNSYVHFLHTQRPEELSVFRESVEMNHVLVAIQRKLLDKERFDDNEKFYRKRVLEPLHFAFSSFYNEALCEDSYEELLLTYAGKVDTSALYKVKVLSIQRDKQQNILAKQNTEKSGLLTTHQASGG